MHKLYFQQFKIICKYLNKLNGVYFFSFQFFVLFVKLYNINSLKIFKINIFSHSLHDQNKKLLFLLILRKQILSMTAEHTFINF